MNSQDYRNLQEAYLDVYGELDESAAGDVADKARKLANQKKGQTPERKKMYQDLEYKAKYRDTYGDGSSHRKRSERTVTDRGISPRKSQERSSDYDIGGSTYTLSQKERLPNSKEKYRRQVATGVRDVSAQERKRLGVKGVSRYNVKDLQDVKDSYEYDLYDVILEYLLNEGYANTQEAAERIMVNMSEDWRESIVETRMDPRGRPASGPMNVYANPKGKPSQAHLDAVKSYEDEQRKKTPEQRKKELDDYRERQMNNK